MKKKHDPKSVILTIILIITYALSVVFNFSHMMDGKGSRKPGFATAGLFLLAAFVYIIFKRMNKRPLVRRNGVLVDFARMLRLCADDVLLLQ